MQEMDLNTIKKIRDDGFYVVNGREYEFDKMKWKDARRVFVFFSKNANSNDGGQFDFMEHENFEKIEALMFSHISFNGHLLSKIKDSHFEEYTGDYIPLLFCGLSVFSYPFIQDLISD